MVLWRLGLGLTERSRRGRFGLEGRRPVWACPTLVWPDLSHVHGTRLQPPQPCAGAFPSTHPRTGPFHPTTHPTPCPWLHLCVTKRSSTSSPPQPPSWRAPWPGAPCIGGWGGGCGVMRRGRQEPAQRCQRTSGGRGGWPHPCTHWPPAFPARSLHNAPSRNEEHRHPNSCTPHAQLPGHPLVVLEVKLPVLPGLARGLDAQDVGARVRHLQGTRKPTRPLWQGMLAQSALQRGRPHPSHTGWLAGLHACVRVCVCVFVCVCARMLKFVEQSNCPYDM